MANIGILGAGAFGTSLALLTHTHGHRVRVWAFEEDLPARVKEERENAVYLPGFRLPGAIEFSNDFGFVMDGADLVLVVVPTQFVRRTLEAAKAAIPRGVPVACCAKGIERESLKLLHDVLAETLPETTADHAFVSGPSFAKEIAAGLPCDVAVASREPGTARRVQSILHAPAFRVYTSDDPVGIETAGALKNVVAIASGTADEMGVGLSARASLISRGLAEITRLGVAMGARAVTFLGLAGVGDLVLTCTGTLSRNYTLGTRIAHGEKAGDILASQAAVAEGYYTAKPAYLLAQKLGVDAPITEQVYHVLYEDRELSEAIRLLMTRGPKSELTGIL